MLQFNAHDFAEITRDLAYFRINIRLIDGVNPILPPDLSFPKKVSEIRDRCKNIGLNFTAIQCDRLSELMEKKNPRCSPEAFDQAITEVSNRIIDELQTTFFLSLNNEEKNLYEVSKPPFGTDVQSKFPSATFDIDEAVKCLALGRYTASVFHLMRVMETALHAVHACLGINTPITGNDKTWGSILQKIRENYKLRINFVEKDLFQELYALLDSVKDAWRNSTMHVEDKYTGEEAKHIFAVVKGFMQKLSSRMDEQGVPLA